MGAEGDQVASVKCKKVVWFDFFSSSNSCLDAESILEACAFSSRRYDWWLTIHDIAFRVTRLSERIGILRNAKQHLNVDSVYALNGFWFELLSGPPGYEHKYQADFTASRSLRMPSFRDHAETTAFVTSTQASKRIILQMATSQPAYLSV
ncbi:hypothetical protein E2P81_ATG00269 [Venturia nashicola]|uniref:Uncharacterized protein n=1 Tax=Venturia nashicola TaxID=86259 RepID=A0A4Z1PEY0_9PEZI|nr:hypothetical protein E6O75_ATG00280 [Venturia nashicola]TLD39282.1 hypothetical protein E2P81_ATG00269 [Venturia nashicola]